MEPEKSPQILGKTNQPTLYDLIFQSLYFRKEGQYFLNQTVYIDDYTFVRCRFDNCTLITNKGTFKFLQCVIGNGTVIRYGGEALKITKLFNSMSVYGQYYPSFLAKINADGTFNIE